MVNFSKKKILSIFAVSILLVVFTMCFAPWGIVYIGTLLLEEPAKPEIVREEFSFTLIYDSNGERKMIKDT